MIGKRQTIRLLVIPFLFLLTTIWSTDPFGHGLVRATAAGADRFAGLGKISALGIKVSRHCTYHGVALNVGMDLEPFSRIDPCGYAGLRTVDLRTLGIAVSWEEAATLLAQRLAAQLKA